jgi:hypothetical protein
MVFLVCCLLGQGLAESHRDSFKNISLPSNINRFAFVLRETPQKYFLYNISSKLLRCSMVSLVSCDENKPRVSLNTEA